MTTKKFKSLQEPKGIWVVEVKMADGIWEGRPEWASSCDRICVIKRQLVKKGNSGEFGEWAYNSDGSLNMKLFRFRRYVPASARKTRKK